VSTIREQLEMAWLAGRVLDLAPDRPDEVPDKDADLVGVPADLLLDLVTSPPVGHHPRGLRIRGARITGSCAWDWQELKAPLILSSCLVEEPIDLTSATIPNLTIAQSRIEDLNANELRCTHTLSLSGTHAHQINLEGADITGDVFMSDGFNASGEICLLGAHIGGELDLSGAALTNPDGDALTADNADITGSVYMRDGFNATGEIRLLGAHIGGQLDLSGAALTNPDGDALNADNADITGSVYMSDGFNATGQIRLPGAHIGGNLELSGAVLINPDGNALNADGADITGSLYMREGFNATGQIHLPNAHIGGNLDLTGASLRTPDAFALGLEGATVDGCLWMQEMPHPPEGIVNLTRTRVGELRDDQGSWPAKGQLILTSFVYERIALLGTKDAETRLEWLRRAHTYSPQPYRQLAATLTTAGHTDDARTISIARHDDERCIGQLTLRQRAWNQFLSVTVAHGYRPERPLWVLIPLLIATGVLVQWAALTGAFVPTGNNVPTSQGGKPTVSVTRCTSDYPCLSAGAYALENNTPILDLHQAENWQPDTSNPLGWRLRWWLYANALIGWAGTSLIIAALTGLTDHKE
jgi:hypothetical protein